MIPEAIFQANNLGNRFFYLGLNMKMRWLIRGVILLAVLGLCVPSVVVFAAPDLPDDDPTYSFIYVNRSLLETDDFLLVAEYNVPYETPPLPDDPINVNYIFELIAEDGVTKLGTGSPYPYEDKGYNLGVISFYFSATDAPDWNKNYILRITGNPSKFPDPPVYSATIPLSAYSLLLSTDTEGNQEELAERIRILAAPLEISWDIVLLSAQDADILLTSAGETYFTNAIPGLRNMAPSLFFTQIVGADTSTRTWGTSLGDTYMARLYGVDGLPGTADDHWMYTAMATAADNFNIPYVLLVGIGVVGICVVLIWQSSQKFGTAMPGYVGSLLVVMCGGILTMGFTVIALVTLALVLGGGWFLFMRKA